MSERHEETDAFQSRDVFRKGLELLMVQQVHVLFADFGEVILAFDFHRLRFDPFPVFPVAAVGGHFTDIDFRVEVGCERITVIPAVAIQNIDIFDFVEIVFQRISGKYMRLRRGRIRCRAVP